MMKEVDAMSEDVQTPQDCTRLKAIRYEDAENGRPPVTVASINPPKLPSTSRLEAPADQATFLRPRTSPSPRSRSPLNALDDAKRDSGIAPSVTTSDRVSYTESNISSSVIGVTRGLNLPTRVQDDESPSTLARSRSPFQKRRSKDRARPSTASSAIQRIESFKGIQSEIPSGSLGDIGLEDLASDKIAFSPRGSLLFGGKKMNDLVESQDGGSTQLNTTTIPQHTGDDHAMEREKAPEEVANKESKQGLVAGRRKPSIHALKAAIHSGRVLSAEEITFSMKVRSMYDHEDERAGDWHSMQHDNDIDQEGSKSVSMERSTPEPSVDHIVVDKTRQIPDDEPTALRSSTSEVRASYYRKPAEQTASIEDWEDVSGRDVDRYGFINPKRPISGTSYGSQAPREGIQRVATSLRVEADRPRRNRKLLRGSSITKLDSRSVPSKADREGTVQNGSVRSFKSNRSIGQLHSGNPFRSKDKRTLTEASDMLTLPPGLADIAEQEDANRTVSAAKRRELSREEKWQKMAQPIRQKPESAKTVGGGMRFEFDTNDQKVVSRTWKGIPDRWRATAWHSFLSSSAKKRGIGASDEELVGQFHKLQEQSSADDVQIDVDVPRTISMHIMFRRRYKGGQRLLFRVLHAVSLYFPETGYVQGMASLAATLLCYYDEERAFLMMVRLWQLRGLEQLFEAGFGGLMKALEDFEKDWLRVGDVAQRLEELGITSTAYGTRWYLTLFNMSIPFPAQLRVWDAFMLLGDASNVEGNAFGGADLDVLHATSAALIDATREIILDSDFENAMKVLTSFVPIKDEDLLMRVTRAEWKMRKKRGTLKT